MEVLEEWWGKSAVTSPLVSKAALAPKIFLEVCTAKPYKTPQKQALCRSTAEEPLESTGVLQKHYKVLEEYLSSPRE